MEVAWRLRPWRRAFSANILRARDTHLTLLQASSQPPETLAKTLIKWLADPPHRIPLHHGGSQEDGQPNWRLLGRLMGRGTSTKIFNQSRTGNEPLARRIVFDAIAAGCIQPGSLVESLAHVTRRDARATPGWSALMMLCSQRAPPGANREKSSS
ncbi:hypothetical protein ACH4U6_36695 [Streptomyces netropsis]|uniref:hypothetical protein n=1 Tax=Streptomyces netropsis TaxID=55404 RepID=UPI0037B897B2